MNILIVNDDGIKSDGLKYLVEALKPLGHIYIAAPETHQSGQSQALSLGKTLKIKDYKNLYGAVKAYSVFGTPADALKLGLFLFKDIKFDLVASGINQGPNMGSDVLRSGTVGAASEAVHFGLPAIALSSAYHDFTVARNYTYDVVKFLIDQKAISNKYLLNINFPSEKFSKPKGIYYATQGLHKHRSDYKQVGKNKYKAIYVPVKATESKNSDVYGFLNGYITITPVIEDRSCKETIKQLNDKTKLNEFIIYDKIN